MHLGHNGQSCQSRGTLEDVSMAGAKEEEEQEADLLEDVSGLWAVRILLSLLTAMGFSFTHIQWCACPGSAPSHPTVQTWSIFSQVIRPDFFHF